MYRETGNNHKQTSVIKHQSQKALEVMCAWRTPWVILNDIYHIGHLHFSVTSPFLQVFMVPAVYFVYIFFQAFFFFAASYLLFS